MSLQSGTRYTVGVDIGGTFTDVVLVGSDGAVATKKLASTPDDYGRGIITGLEAVLADVGAEPSAVAQVVHGTTVATNAILERRGATTALVTTKGFRDVLEIQRIRIPELYNLFYEKPKPLVPRRRRFEVEERVGPGGVVWQPLSMSSAREAVQAVRDSGAEAVAVCFLHSYANPEHERRLRELLEEELPDVFVTASSDLLPEIREYERTSTTVINAYVGPIVKQYMTSLVDRLRELGVPGRLLVMQSNGGVMTVETAISRPAQLVESGPAAGVTAVARARPHRRVHERDHARHGRHHGEGVTGRGRRGRVDLRVRGRWRHQREQHDGPGRRVSAEGAGDRHRRDRGGWRQHRLDRPRRTAPARSAQRGRRAGPGLLRHRGRPSRP